MTLDPDGLIPNDISPIDITLTMVARSYNLTRVILVLTTSALITPFGIWPKNRSVAAPSDSEATGAGPLLSLHLQVKVYPALDLILVARMISSISLIYFDQFQQEASLLDYQLVNQLVLR